MLFSSAPLSRGSRLRLQLIRLFRLTVNGQRCCGGLLCADHIFCHALILPLICLSYVCYHQIAVNRYTDPANSINEINSFDFFEPPTDETSEALRF